MDCKEKAIAIENAKSERQGDMLPCSAHRFSASSEYPLDQADAQSINAAASTETPNTSAVLGFDLASAQDVLVGEGKYHAVSEGSIGPSGLSTVGDADAGAGVVMTKVPHWTSLPEYVTVRLVSVGPVMLFSLKSAPNEEYSVHVAAVVDAS